MKKIMRKILPVTAGAAALVVGSLYMGNPYRDEMPVLLLENIEALAQEYESNVGSCTSYGCLWSFTTTCNVYTTNMHIFLMSCPNMRG